MDNNAGIKFLIGLTLLFVMLRGAGLISWAWYWIVSPLWIPFAVVGGLMVFLFICALLFD